MCVREERGLSSLNELCAEREEQPPLILLSPHLIFFGASPRTLRNKMTTRTLQQPSRSLPLSHLPCVTGEVWEQWAGGGRARREGKGWGKVRRRRRRRGRGAPRARARGAFPSLPPHEALRQACRLRRDMPRADWRLGARPQLGGSGGRRWPRRRLPIVSRLQARCWRRPLPALSAATFLTRAELEHALDTPPWSRGPGGPNKPAVPRSPNQPPPPRLAPLLAHPLLSLSTGLRKNRKKRGHVSAGHGRVGKHRKVRDGVVDRRAEGERRTSKREETTRAHSSRSPPPALPSPPPLSSSPLLFNSTRAAGAMRAASTTTGS